MRYEGMLCDSCGKLLCDQDDIVTCPVCGTPQHRECWVERGMCIHAAEHDTGFRWVMPEAQVSQDDTRCPVCRTVNPPDTLICPHCGSTLFAQDVPPVNRQPAENPFLFRVRQQPDETIDGVRVEDMATYIQGRAYSYINTFQKLEKKKTRASFHWASFFFGYAWFFYRKLYGAALLLLGLSFALSLLSYSAYEMLQAEVDHFYTLVQEESATQEQLQQSMDKVYASIQKLAPYGAAYLASSFIAAFTANRLYKRRVLKEVRSIRQHTRQDGDAFRNIALRRGGVSFFSVVGAWLLLQALGTLVNRLLM